MKLPSERDIRKERQRLLSKMFDGGLTVPEKDRLEQVRALLDEIEAFRYGPDLERLERVADAYEKFAKELQSAKGYLVSMLEPQ